MKELNKVRSKYESLEQEMAKARAKQRECDDTLQTLGGKKRNKTPDILAQIQTEIDSLRAEKQKAIALQKHLESELSKLRLELARLEKIEVFNQRQAERDKLATTQHNGSGKHPTLGRDTTWRI